MRPTFLTAGVVLMIVGAGLGVYWLNSPVSANTIGYGTTLPGTQYGLAFYYPQNGTMTFTVSYAYGDQNSSVYLVACENLTIVDSYCASDNTPLSAPLRDSSGATNLTGSNGQGTYTLPSGPYKWYVVVTNEPLVVIVKAQPTLLSDGLEIAAIALIGAGVGVTVASFLLKDPLRRPTPKLAQLKRTLYFFFQNRLAVLGLALLVFFILVAVFAPVLAPTAPAYYTTGENTVFGTPYTNPVYCVLNASTLGVGGAAVCPQASYVLQVACTIPPCNVSGDIITVPSAPNMAVIPPSWTFSLTNPFNLGPLPFGSMYTGAPEGIEGGATFINIYASVVRATPTDLMLSATVVGAGATVGIFLGALAGFVGGYTDEVVMRVTDIFLSIPGILLTIIILVVATASITNFTVQYVLELLVISFVITWWPGYTRLVRGQVLVTREQKYVEAARASGGGTGRILGRHIIPNSIYPVFVQMSLDVGSVPLLFGVIAYLGFDNEIKLAVQYGIPELPEWGSLSSSGVSPLALSNILVGSGLGGGVPFPWWQFLFPGLALFLFAISVNFLADGLRDALDPRLRR